MVFLFCSALLCFALPFDSGFCFVFAVAVAVAVFALALALALCLLVQTLVSAFAFALAFASAPTLTSALVSIEYGHWDRNGHRVGKTENRVERGRERRSSLPFSVPFDNRFCCSSLLLEYVLPTLTNLVCCFVIVM